MDILEINKKILEITIKKNVTKNMLIIKKGEYEKIYENNRNIEEILLMMDEKIYTIYEIVNINKEIDIQKKIDNKNKYIQEIDNMIKEYEKYIYIDKREIELRDILEIWGSIKYDINGKYIEYIYNIGKYILWKDRNELLNKEVYINNIKYNNNILKMGISESNRKDIDKKILQYNELKDILIKTGNIDIYDFQIEQKVYNILHNIKYGNEMIIFDNFKTNKFMPYIVINRDIIKTDKKGVKISEKRIYKIYNNNKNLIYMKDWIKDTNIPKTIQFKIYNKNENIQSYNNKNSYSNIEYNFDNNKFTLYYNIDKITNINEIYNRFISNFVINKNINILNIKNNKNTNKNNKLNKISKIESYNKNGNIYEYNIKDIFTGIKEYQMMGNMIKPNYIINNRIFIDMIMTNETLRRYIYIDESQHLFAQKKRLTLHIILEDNHITTTLSSKESKKSEKFYYKNKRITLKPNQQYLNIQINKIPNKKYLKFIKILISKLMMMYYEKYTSIYEYYNKYINNKFLKIDKIRLIDEYINIKNKSIDDIRDKSNMTNLRLLKYYDNDLFVTHYATKCQAPSQPKPINEQEIAYWKNKGRQVVKFPAKIKNSNKTFNYKIQNYYVSSSDDTPYIGLMENTLSNKDDYPYIICSYKEKHIEVDPNTWDITILKLPGKNKKNDTDKFINRYILDSNKILQFLRFGYLRNQLNIIFNNKIFLRVGIPQIGKSSLLHCVLLSLDKYRKKYLSISDDLQSLEKYVTSFRNKIANNVPLFISKQENYDISINDIYNNLLNYDHFLDPGRYIKLIESYFNIKLFVFSVDNNNNDILYLPRFLFFYIHNFYNIDNNIPIVIVFFHQNIQHCELIINYDIDVDDNVTDIQNYNIKNIDIFNNNLVFNFVDKNINYNLNNLLFNVSNMFNFYFNNLNLNSQYNINNNNKNILSNNLSNIFYNNLSHYNFINISRDYLFPTTNEWKLIGQYIDCSGKVRALILYNIKDKSSINDIYSKYNINYYDDNVHLLSNPNFKQNVITIFIPIINILNIPCLPLIPTNTYIIDNFIDNNKLSYYKNGFIYNDYHYTFYIKSDSNIDHNKLYNYYDHSSRIIKNILVILYNLYTGDYDDFILLFHISNTDIFYNINNITYNIPYFDNFDQALLYFYNKLENLFIDGTTINKYNNHNNIFFNISNTNLYNGMTNFIKNIDNDPSLHLNNIPIYLENYYYKSPDFINHNSYQMLFFNDDNLINTMINNISIDNNLYFDIFFSYQPYILYHNDLFYIVQNVNNSDRDLAISVVFYWYTLLYNPGYYPPHIDQNFPINEISYNKNISIPDRCICKYQNGYCAILPLNLTI